MWQKIKEIPPFVAAIVGIASAAFAAVVWVSGYFATQSQVSYIKCISDKNEELLSHQVLSIGYYNNYIKFSVKLAMLKEKEKYKESIDENMNAEDIKELKELETKAALTWEALQSSDSTANAIDRYLQAGKCNV